MSVDLLYAWSAKVLDAYMSIPEAERPELSEFIAAYAEDDDEAFAEVGEDG